MSLEDTRREANQFRDDKGCVVPLASCLTQSPSGTQKAECCDPRPGWRRRDQPDGQATPARQKALTIWCTTGLNCLLKNCEDGKS